MRSLGMHHVKQGNNIRAMECFEMALELNGLFEQIWFLLGCVAMQLEYWNKALQAFFRTVALDQDNADAWNNLAATHLQLKNPESALKALKEAGKRQYDNWKIWKNIFQVALSLGELLEAITAYRRVVEIMGAEAPLEDLQIILGAFATAVSTYGLADKFVIATSKQIGSLLDKVMANHFSLRYAFWNLCAEYTKIIGENDDTIEFYFKAYRAMQHLCPENKLEDLQIILLCLENIHKNIERARLNHPHNTLDLDDRCLQLSKISENLLRKISVSQGNTIEIAELRKLAKNSSIISDGTVIE